LPTILILSIYQTNTHALPFLGYRYDTLIVLLIAFIPSFLIYSVFKAVKASLKLIGYAELYNTLTKKHSPLSLFTKNELAFILADQLFILLLILAI